LPQLLRNRAVAARRTQEMLLVETARMPRSLVLLEKCPGAD
jgi:hypothetical protein